MSFLELFLLAVGLSMDAFAVAICAGLTMRVASVKKMLIIGLYFGIFQAVMPLIGYLTATWLAAKIISYDHWIAFALLSFLGGKMIIESQKRDADSEGNADRANSEGLYTGDMSDGKDSLEEAREGAESSPGLSRVNMEASLKPERMLPLAIATSIDALAAGVSFAFLRVNIIPAVLFIGAATLTISMAGVKIGNIFGTKYKSGAELTGGIILVLIGLKVLIDHLIT